MNTLVLIMIGSVALSTIIALPFVAKAPFDQTKPCPNFDTNSHKEGGLKVYFTNLCANHDSLFSCHECKNGWYCKKIMRFTSLEDLEHYIVKRVLNGHTLMPDRPYAGIDKEGLSGITFIINPVSNDAPLIPRRSQYAFAIGRIEDETGILFNRANYDGIGRNHSSESINNWLDGLETRLKDIGEIEGALFYIN